MIAITIALQLILEAVKGIWRADNSMSLNHPQKNCQHIQEFALVLFGAVKSSPL